MSPTTPPATRPVRTPHGNLQCGMAPATPDLHLNPILCPNSPTCGVQEVQHTVQTRRSEPCLPKPNTEQPPTIRSRSRHHYRIERRFPSSRSLGYRRRFAAAGATHRQGHPHPCGKPNIVRFSAQRPGSAIPQRSYAYSATKSE
jgi:hypothetical protein